MSHAPHVASSATSRAAAHAIEDHLPDLERRVFEWLLRHDGATDEQAQEGLGMPGSTQRPRRIKLVERGLVADSGRRAPTRSGRLAVIWQASAPLCQITLWEP